MKKTFIHQLTDLIAKFLGSWWAVVTHTIWFTFWIIFHFNIDTLTLFVSLEAIFIGIFLLMAANRQEMLRDIQEAKERAQMMVQLEKDVDLDQKETHAIDQLTRQIAALRRDIKELKKS